MIAMERNDQGNLFGQDTPPPYVRGSDTSVAAAKSVAPKTQSMRDRVEAFIKKKNWFGATCDEVEVAIKMSHQTTSARIRELFKMGRLKDSTFRRNTRSGRKARVLVSVRAQESNLASPGHEPSGPPRPLPAGRS